MQYFQQQKLIWNDTCAHFIRYVPFSDVMAFVIESISLVNKGFQVYSLEWNWKIFAKFTLHDHCLLLVQNYGGFD
jgi:hypothetical protein